MNIAEVQELLQKSNLEGWLLYDFQGLNPIAKKLVGLQGNLLTRRWYYWIPRAGTPFILCNQIEKHNFEALPGALQIFKSWEEMVRSLKEMLAGSQTIAMEYSPNCAIPYVSRIDAGTVELIRSFGKQIVSSADLVQHFEARWSQTQLAMHLEASRLLMQTLFETFTKVKTDLQSGVPMSEYSLQQFMMECFASQKIAASSPPIIAVNSNSGNPHYEPSREISSPIRRGDLLLIDWWGKLDQEGAVYADYTWMAYLGGSIPEKVQNIWNVVKQARDAAIDFVRQTYPIRPLQGWQVDAVSREVIAQAGYGDFFIHRTGHNIGEQDHGNGANMDNLETRDERQLIPRTCFSIEPGIYLPDFGIRSEVNVYLDENAIRVTGEPVQNDIFIID